MLDPQARQLIDTLTALGAPPVQKLTPEQARAGYVKRCAYTQPKPPEVAQVQQHSASPAPGSNAAIPIRSYRPLGTPPSEVLPALVYYHGGGWVLGDLETHDVLCRQLANASGCAVFAVHYRLAPEHPFPAAFDDALAAAHWVHANAKALSIDPQRIAVGGDSAGGNLAAAACLHLRDTASTWQPAFQLLIYPVTHVHGPYTSYQENANGYLLTTDAMLYFLNQYAKPEEQGDWRVSPLQAPSHTNLPPALVLTAGFDPLRDEGAAYADALSCAGVAAQYVHFPRQIHGFVLMTAVIDEALTAVELCAAALRRALRA
jgi:acetyl esterase